MHTSYKGRRGAFQLMVLNAEIRKLIFEEASTEDIRQAAIANGMHTLAMDGTRKALQGLTTCRVSPSKRSCASPRLTSINSLVGKNEKLWTSIDDNACRYRTVTSLADVIRNVGVIATYCPNRMKRFHPNASLNLLYALQAAIMNVSLS